MFQQSSQQSSQQSPPQQSLPSSPQHFFSEFKQQLDIKYMMQHARNTKLEAKIIMQ